MDTIKPHRAFSPARPLAFLLAAITFIPAASSPAAESRVLTMSEAISLALSNNLDIRISRITPELDMYSLRGLYSTYYEPAFSFSTSQYYSASAGGIDPVTGQPYPAYTSTDTSFNPSVGGTAPSGLSYGLGSQLGKSYFTAGEDIPVPIGTNSNGTTNYRNVHVGEASSSYSYSPLLTLKQPLVKNLWIDNSRLQIALSKKTLKMDQLATRLQIMTTINTVKAAYYNLIYSFENVKVNEAAVKLAQQLYDEDSKKVELGALAPLDEKQAQSQLATSRSDLFSAQETLAGQENILKSLITDSYASLEYVMLVPAEKLLAVPERLDLQECLRTGVTHRPELLSARIGIEKQHVTIKFVNNQLYPEVDLTGTLGYNGTTSLGYSPAIDSARSGANPTYSVGLSVTIPLGNGAVRNQYKSARATLQQLLLQLKKTEQTIVVAIDNDVATVGGDYEKVQSTREASIYAEDALKAEQTKLEAGKSTSFIVLQLQNNLTTARSAEIRALADYNIALEQLAFDEGATLERNHISLSEK